MAIDPRALIEPSFVLGGVYAHHQYVPFPKIRKISHVKTEGNIAAHVLADVMAIEHDHGISIDAVKLDADASSLVSSRKIEHAAVPADACFGIFATERLCALMV